MPTSTGFVATGGVDAIDDSLTTNEDTPLNIPQGTLIGNDTDADGDPLSILSVSATSSNGGTVSLSSGTVTYTPAANFNGTDTFTYIVTDGLGGTDIATVTVTVTPVNDAPVATDDAQTTSENVALNIPAATLLANDTDVDGDTLSITAVSPTSANGGTLALIGGIITYTPAVGFTGTDTFTYTVDDGNGLTDTATVSVSVNAFGNTAPVATDDTIGSTPEDTPLTITAATLLANDTDVDGDILSITAVSPTSTNGGTLVLLPGGDISYTPPANYTGIDTFTYTVDDGNGGTDTTTVTINVTPPVNDDPVANDDTVTTTQDVPLNIASATLLANDTDVDGDTLSVSSVSAVSANGGTVSLNIVSGQITYTPPAGFSGSDTFTYTAADGNGGTDTATVTVAVNATGNTSPVGINDTLSTLEDSSFSITEATLLGNDTDADGDTLSISAVSSSSARGGSITFSGGIITYTPALNFNGTDTFTYTVDDGNGGSDVATVTITVIPVNDDPVANDDTVVATQNTPLNIITSTLLANDSDVDGDTLTITNVSGVSTRGGSLTLTNGVITYTPPVGFIGTDSFTYEVNDGNGATDTATVRITVGAQQTDAVDDTASTREDTPLVLSSTTVLANDSNASQVLNVSATSANGGRVSFNPTTGDITYTPAANFNGTDTFTYTAADETGAITDTATVTITVIPVNDRPDAANDNVSTDENTPLAISVSSLLANDTDVEGNTLSITGVLGTSANGGSVTLSGNTINYSPANGFTGTDVFTYTISDGQGGFDTASVVVTVAPRPANVGPNAADDSFSVTENAALNINASNLLSNDTDANGDSLSISSINNVSANGGSITFNSSTGAIQYTPCDWIHR